MGSVLEFNLIDFVFEDLRLEKLNCEVLETNEAVVKMHKKFGFLEEGFRRANVIKENKRIGVHLLGLTKSNWLMSHREIMKERYKEKFSKYNLKIEHDI